MCKRLVFIDWSGASSLGCFMSSEGSDTGYFVHGCNEQRRSCWLEVKHGEEYKNKSGFQKRATRKQRETAS